MKERIKILLMRVGIYQLYSKLINWRDDVTSAHFECSLGDILLMRDVPDSYQLLFTSRLLDVEEYLENGNDSFPFQNVISTKAYGNNHRKDDGNKAFKSLIESYKKDGYRTDSYVTVDRDMVLLDENHRMGLQIYEKYVKVSAKMLKRRAHLEYGGDWYYRVGLPTDVLERIYSRFSDIQNWLQEMGMTFCMLSDAKKEDAELLIKDLGHLVNILKVSPFTHTVNYNHNSIRGGVLIQFSSPRPEYYVEKGQLISKRSEKIERVLRGRYPGLFLCVSRNCMEGMEMYRVI